MLLRYRDRPAPTGVCVCIFIDINIYLYTNTHVPTCPATWAGPSPLDGRGLSLVVRNPNNAGCWVLNNILFWNNFLGWGNCYLQPPKPVSWVYALGNLLSKYLEETTRSSTKRVSSCSPPDTQHLCSPCAASDRGFPRAHCIPQLSASRLSSSRVTFLRASFRTRSYQDILISLSVFMWFIK